MSSAADLLSAFEAAADSARAEELTTRFGAGRYCGASPDWIEAQARETRQAVSFPERLTVAQELWADGLFEAQILAAKLLTQARIAEDGPVWTQICNWLQDASTWAHVDALAAAGGRRVLADLSRLAWVEARANSEAPLDRRMALQLTAPLAKLPHPDEAQVSALDTAADWLPAFLEDGHKDVRRTAETWMRSLTKHHYKRAKMIRQIVAERDV